MGRTFLSERFVGTWKLVSNEHRSDTETTYPYGKDALGYIMYTSDGYMSVAIMSRNRRRFTSADMAGAAVEEKAAAASAYFSYCGKYKVEEGKVIHVVELSLYPNTAGENVERFYRFEGDKLILNSKPTIVEGKKRTTIITWQRVK